MSAIAQEKMETLILDNIGGLVLQEEHLHELVRLTNEELANSLGHLEERLQMQDSQIGDLDRRLGHLYDALETGQLTVTELAPRIRELQERRELLARARGELQETLSEGQVEQVSWETVLSNLGNLREILDYGSVAEQKLILRSFVQWVEKLESQVVIHYFLPLPPAAIQEDTAGVLDIVQSGGPDETIPHSSECSRFSWMVLKDSLDSGAFLGFFTNWSRWQVTFMDFKSSEGYTMIPSLLRRSSFSSEVASSRFRSRNTLSSLVRTAISIL